MRDLYRLLALTALVADPAFAFDYEEPMSFSIYLRRDVLAVGEFDDETPKRFIEFLDRHNVTTGATVHFTSGGGALEAGLIVGREIRRRKLNSNVGSPRALNELSDSGLFKDGVVNFVNRSDHPLLKSPYPSFCLSACTFAFMGGVERSLTVGSAFGVHQFYRDCRVAGACDGLDFAKGLSDGQGTMAGLVAYLQEMGVDPNMLQAMVSTKGDETLLLTPAQLAAYKITFSTTQEAWRLMQGEDGHTTLYGEIGTASKAQGWAFSCGAEGDGLLMVLSFDIAGVPASHSEIDTALKHVRWAIGELSYFALDGEIIGPDAIRKTQILGGGASVLVIAPEAVVRTLEKQQTSMSFGIRAGRWGWPLEIRGRGPSPEIFRNYLKSCAPG